MPHIFISYARSDEDVVAPIVSGLESRSVECWRDCDDIEPGGLWSPQIVQAIRSAMAFVVFLSPDSAFSQYVSKELALALKYRIRIIPVMLRETKIPKSVEFPLEGEQWIYLHPNTDVMVDEIIKALYVDHLVEIQQIERQLLEKGISWRKWLLRNKGHINWYSFWRAQIDETPNDQELLEVGFVWFRENMDHDDWIPMLKLLLQKKNYQPHVFELAQHWLQKKRGHRQWEVVHALLK